MAAGAGLQVVDAGGLRPPETQGNPDAVLNGITAIPGSPGEFLLAGKTWPTTYRVRFAPKSTNLQWLTINAMKSAFAPFDERIALIDRVIKPGFAALTRQAEIAGEA